MILCVISSHLLHGIQPPMSYVCFGQASATVPLYFFLSKSTQSHSPGSGTSGHEKKSNYFNWNKAANNPARPYAVSFHIMHASSEKLTSQRVKGKTPAPQSKNALHATFLKPYHNWLHK